MTAEYESPIPRYASLRDYLRVLRRYWVMILVLAVVGGLAGVASTINHKPVYKATAEVAYQDPTQGLNLVGLSSATTETPAQLAAIDADTLTRPSVMALVRRRLQTQAPLASNVSAQVALGSGLLQVTATGKTASYAAQLANAFASALVAKDNAQTQAQFNALSKKLTRRIASLTKRSPTDSQLSFYQGELARLQTLGAFVHSAQVAEVAMPGAPSSNGRVRSGLLGLGLGLLLSILAAFVRDSLDRRLRSAKDIESSFNYPLVGHVRETVMGRVPYLPSSASEDGLIDLEAFRILRRNIELLKIDHPPRTILVSSALPEEGKTTVAASLAFAMAAIGRRVLLVDADLRRPALSKRLNIEQSPGLADYLYGEADPRSILRTVEFSDPPVLQGGDNGSAQKAPSHVTHCRLVCIPSGSPTRRAAELLGSGRFRDFLSEASSAYDVIVLDSSPLLPVADTLEMLSNVDAVLICARESTSTRDQALAAKAALERFPSVPTGLIITGVTPRSESYESYSYSYGYG